MVCLKGARGLSATAGASSFHHRKELVVPALLLAHQYSLGGLSRKAMDKLATRSIPSRYPSLSDRPGFLSQHFFSHKINVSGKWPPRVTPTEVKRKVPLQHGRSTIAHCTRQPDLLSNTQTSAFTYQKRVPITPFTTRMAPSGRIPTMPAVTLQAQDWGLGLSSSGHSSRAPTEARPSSQLGICNEHNVALLY